MHVLALSPPVATSRWDDRVAPFKPGLSGVWHVQSSVYVATPCLVSRRLPFPKTLPQAACLPELHQVLAMSARHLPQEVVGSRAIPQKHSRSSPLENIVVG
jgi:hypothetical protein